MSPPRVLVTRPLPQGEQTAEKLRAMGYDPILAPMLRIEPIDPPVLPDFGSAQAVLVTSANGLSRLAALTSARTTLLMTVGDRTATAAKTAGFLNIRSASGDGHALLELARERLKPDRGPVIHVRGYHAAVEFGGLTEDGFQLEEVIAYRAVETAVLPKAALSPSPFSAALVYSARTAKALAEVLQDTQLDPAHLVVIGISAAALQPLSALGACLSVAKSPNEAALLAALAEMVSSTTKN